MTRITRRQLFVVGITGSLGLAGWYVEHHDFERLVASIIRARLNFLDLKQDDLEAFADAFVKDQGRRGLGGRLAALGRPLLAHAETLDLARSEFDDGFEYRVASMFLLSTDFFSNGADESQPVRYVAYFNPTRLACANPFADLSDS